MSTVIKANGSTRMVQGVAFNFEDMTGQANQYLEQVRQRALQIITEAQQQAAEIRARSEEEGRQAAMKAVEKVLDDKVGKRMETLLPALKKAVEDIQHSKQSWLAHWESRAVKLAAAIAGRVMRRQLPDLPDVTVQLVREALAMAAGSSEVRVYLHPADYETLKGQVQRIAEEMSRATPAQIIADATITAGGCRVETKHGAIDQQFEAQLARIEQELVHRHG